MADIDDTVVGLGLESNDPDPKSVLEDLTQYDIVGVYNPMGVAFQGIVAQSGPSPTAMSQKDIEIQMKYNLSLKYPGHQELGHTRQAVRIEAGETKRMLGNVAKVIAWQLINEVMAREGETKNWANKVVRQEYERRIIKSVNPVNDVLDNNQLKSVDQQINEAVEKSNEPEFPTEKSGQAAPGNPEPTEDRTDEASKRPKGNTSSKAAA